MATPRRLERIGDLADSRARAARVDRARKQVALPVARAGGERGERGTDLPRIAGTPHTRETRDLRVAHRAVVDLAHVERGFLVEPEPVDADDHVLAAVDTRLLLGGRRLDPELGPAAVDGARHAAHRLDFLEDRPRAVGHVLREPLHHVGTGQGSTTLVICVSSCRITCVLRAMRAEKSVGSATASSNEFVCSDWVPPNTAAIASIAVRTMLLYGSCWVRLHPDVWHACVTPMTSDSSDEPADDPTPQMTCRAQLGDLHEEVHPDAEEERKAPGETSTSLAPASAART